MLREVTFFFFADDTSEAGQIKIQRNAKDPRREEKKRGKGVKGEKRKKHDVR